MTEKDGLELQTMIPEKLYKEADKIIHRMNKSGFHPFERELILYMAWRFHCRTTDDLIRVNVADDEHEQYWNMRRDTEPSPAFG